jgi:phosphate/phosphite/phosphonate ABC transporter binding protein
MALLVVAGCGQLPPLAIESGAGEGFDPLRYDPGAEPGGELGSTTLRFSTSPLYRADKQRLMVERMRAWLQGSVELPVEVSVVEGSGLEQLLAGDLDVAQLPPRACAKAQARPEELTLLATTIAQGTRTYAGYLVVRADSDLERPADAKGRRLALMGSDSASGLLYPWAWLERHGLDAMRDFQPTLYETHDAVLPALLAGDVEVAAVSSDALVTAGVLGVSGPVRIIAKVGRIPYDCIVARKGLSPRLLWRVRRAFLTLSILSPEGREVLSDHNLFNGFIPVPPGHYDDVLQLERGFGAAVVEAQRRLRDRADPKEAP